MGVINPVVIRMITGVRSALPTKVEENMPSDDLRNEYIKTNWELVTMKRSLFTPILLLNYIKTALRQWRRYPGYALINMLGLAIGLTCCLVIMVFVREERGYDRFHTNADRIYRVTVSRLVGGKEAPATAPGRLGPTLAAELPGVKNQVRIRYVSEPFLVQRGKDRFNETGFCYADPGLFEVFDFTLSAGDPQTALAAPFSLVLSSILAEKYFGEGDPIGQTLTLNGVHTYTITGVLTQQTGRSHLQFDLLASFATFTVLDPLADTWVDGGANAYLLLRPDEDADALRTYLNEQIDTYMGDFAMGFTVHLQPLTEIYFSDWPAFGAELRGDEGYLTVFTAVAILILSLACINYVNLATARALRRTREVGLRKVMGASRGQLMRQYLAESMLLGFMALFVAMLLIKPILPYFNNLITHPLTMFHFFDTSTLLTAVGLTMLVSIIAGSYPSLYLSGFRPIAVLTEKIQTGRGSRLLRRGLIVVQFTITIGLTAGTFVMWDQLDFIRTRQLGFDKEHMVVIPSVDEIRDRYRPLKEELLRQPGVEGVTTASIPGYIGVLMTSHRIEGIDHEKEKVPFIIRFKVDQDFLSLLNIKLLAGRYFDPEQPSDQFQAVVVNETTVRTYGWGTPEEAVGKWVRRPEKRDGEWVSPWPIHYVIGVVADFQTWSAKRALTPLFLYPLRNRIDSNSKILVKISPDEVPGTLARLEKVWADFAPAKPFTYTFLDQEVDAFYRTETRLGQLFNLFASLALIIACLGLSGLAAFMTTQRTKEVGIRKVHGAELSQILALLYRDYIMLVAMAFVIAAPLTYIVMQRWLAQFTTTVGVGLDTLFLVGGGVLLVALATVSYQAIRAAGANPAETLRYE